MPPANTNITLQTQMLESSTVKHPHALNALYILHHIIPFKQGHANTEHYRVSFFPHFDTRAILQALKCLTLEGTLYK